MRGVPKPWPPSKANVSPDGQETRRFADAVQEYGAALRGRADKSGFARAEFHRLDKAELRPVMYVEQRSLCVYCEREISEEDVPRPHIEHWCPLSKSPEHALDWGNLYLSCSTKDTCGHAKGDQKLKDDHSDAELLWPTEFDYEKLVGFTSNGEIYVRNDVTIDQATRRALELAINGDRDGGRRRQAILKLNHRTLVESRRGALDSERSRLRRHFEGRTASIDSRDARAACLLDGSQRPRHVSIRVAWLRKMLGHGRDS